MVVVQSTGRQRADALNAADGCYHVAVQGIMNGEVVNNTEAVSCIQSALHAGSQWEEVLALVQTAYEKMRRLIGAVGSSGL